MNKKTHKKPQGNDSEKKSISMPRGHWSMLQAIAGPYGKLSTAMQDAVEEMYSRGQYKIAEAGEEVEAEAEKTHRRKDTRPA